MPNAIFLNERAAKHLDTQKKTIAETTQDA
jgi:hypothetical protein